MVYYSGYDVKSLIPLASRLATLLLHLKESRCQVTYQRYVRRNPGLINVLEQQYRKELEKIAVKQENVPGKPGKIAD